MTDLAPLWALCTLNDDALKDSTLREFTFEYVDISNVTEGNISEELETTSFGAAPSRARRLAQSDDIIISTVRTYLRAIARVKVTESQRVYSTGFAVLRPTQGAADSRYLAYVLTSNQVMDEIIATSVGVSYPAIQGTALHRLRVPHRDLETQRAIAAYLDRETGDIDAMIVKMDELAKVLRRRVAHTSSAFGLNVGEQEANEGSHSPLAGIPAHWGQTKFGYDFTESTERNGDDPPGPLLSISEYRGVELNLRSDGQQPSEDVADYRVVRPGQLAANMMWLNHGGLGVSDLTGYISPDYKSFWISERFDPRYVHYLFRSPRYISYFGTIATGVRPNAQRVTKTALDMVPLPLPPLDEQRHIADHLDEVTGRIDAMLAKVAELKSLLIERRAALIADVVSGRKRVA